MMKIIFIGCVKFSLGLIGAVAQVPDAQIVGIVTKRRSDFNTDFVSLAPFAERQKIPIYIIDDQGPENVSSWISSFNADVVYCFGWSDMLTKDILASSQLGCIGYHPAALPNNRGRHPIIWALALGLRETASSFFFMNHRADSGDIVSQRFVAIDQNADAGILYEKLLGIACEQVRELTIQLINGNYIRKPQNESEANYWRKRTHADGIIDWRMTADAIHNLVRALTHPYCGASCNSQGQEISIWKTEPLNYTENNVEPGKIVESSPVSLVVKCGENAIRLIEHEFEVIPKKGEYL